LGLGLFIAAAAATGEPATFLQDGNGYWWDFNANGSVDDGRSPSQAPDAVDAFDNAMRLSINGAPFPDAPQVTELSGRMLVTGPVSVAGLTVIRRAYVPDAAGEGWACFLEYLENPTGADLAVNVRISGNLGSDGDTAATATSSGDTVFSVDDRWVASDDANNGGGDPSLNFNYWGAGASVQPSAVFLPASQEDYYVDYPHVTVPANSTVVLMHFCAQNADNAAAASNAAYLDGLPAPALTGLNANLAPVVNWNVPTDALTIIPADTFTAAGQHQGPFAPASRDYSLKNDGDAPLSWSAAGPVWADVTPDSGSGLAPGASVTVTVSFNAVAAALLPREYAGAVVFTNEVSGAKFARQILLTVFERLTVAEPGGYDAAGFQGGPFTPASATYTLTNDGTPEPLAWSVSTPAWLDAVPADSAAAGGPLAPGASVTVTVTPNANTEALTPGTYGGLVMFSNDTFASSQSRAVSLDVRERLAISPETESIVRGLAGGPFTPATLQWTLSNQSPDAPVNWSLAPAAPDWLLLDQTGGTLNPGASVTLTGQVNAGAKPVGDYFDLVTIRNDSYGSELAVSATLRVKDVVYVDINAASPGDGSSWAAALDSVQAGINAADAADSWVWVAAGTYPEYLVMAEGVEVYGGFAGNETALDARDIEAHATIIDANRAGRVAAFGAIAYAGLDGFTLTGGQGDNTGGGGVRCDGTAASCFLRNCSILNNVTQYRGGGIYCLNNAAIILERCTIAGNVIEDIPGRDFGGGICCWQASPNILDCRIAGNESRYGAGLGCVQASPRVLNCIISGNVAAHSILNPANNQPHGSGGGGIFAHDHSSPVVVNCVLSGNCTQNWGAGALYCQGQSEPVLTNCTILSNRSRHTAGYEIQSGIVVNSGSWPSLTNCVLADMSNFAIFEEAPWPAIPANKANVDAAYCLFSNNGTADFHDDDTAANYTGGDALDAQVDGCSHNVPGNPVPRFAAGVLGQWSAAPVYDAAANVTTLNVSSPLFAGMDLRGRLINADRTQTRHALILAHTDQSLSVPGDITAATGAYGYVQNGDSFEILDLHPRGDSPCVNAGNFAAPELLDRDLEGSARVGAVDLGAYESASPSGATVLSIAPVEPRIVGDDPVQFEVLFSRGVTGVDSEDFTVTGTQGQSGDAILSVTGGDHRWIVTIDPGSRSGTIHLNLIDNGTIVDTLGFPLEGGDFTGGGDAEWISLPVAGLPGLAALVAVLAVIGFVVSRKRR
jgi:hypothetical protein